MGGGCVLSMCTCVPLLSSKLDFESRTSSHPDAISPEKGILFNSKSRTYSIKYMCVRVGSQYDTTAMHMHGEARIKIKHVEVHVTQ